MASYADTLRKAPNEPTPPVPVAERLAKRLDAGRRSLVERVAEVDDLAELADLVTDIDRDREHPVTTLAEMTAGASELHAARIRGLAERLKIK